MKNKLKLVLWGKKLQLPEDFNKLKFDNYELEYDNEYGYDLYIYKNNKMIKEIWYWENGNKCHESNYKNGERNGKQYEWWVDGELDYEWNYKDGILIENT